MSKDISKQEKEQLVVQYIENKDHQLKDKIVAAYQPLVEYIARKLTFQRDDLPDLVQVGTIGLLKSLDKFNIEREVAFSTFSPAATSSAKYGTIFETNHDLCEIASAHPRIAIQDKPLYQNLQPRTFKVSNSK